MLFHILSCFRQEPQRTRRNPWSKDVELHTELRTGSSDPGAVRWKHFPLHHRQNRRLFTHITTCPLPHHVKGRVWGSSPAFTLSFPLADCSREDKLLLGVYQSRLIAIYIRFTFLQGQDAAIRAVRDAMELELTLEDISIPAAHEDMVAFSNSWRHLI